MLDLHTAAPKLLLAGLIALLGAALAILPLKWASLLVVVGAGLPVLLVKPEWILCLLALAVPFGSIRELSLGPVSIGGAELLIALLLAAWLMRMVAARRVWLPRAPLLLPLSLFVTVLLFSLLPAVSLELSAKEIVKWLEVIIVYWFMAEAVDARWGKWLVWALLAAGSAEALVGVYQFLRRVGPEGFVLFGRFLRAYGHFAQPNPFAGYMGLTLPLAYALTLESIGQWRSWFRTRPGRCTLATTFQQGALGASTCDRPGGPGAALPTKRLLTWLPVANVLRTLEWLLPLASFGVLAMAMIMSWSRGGWLGMVGALLVVTVVRSRKALLVGMAIALLMSYIVLAGGAQYLPPAVVQRVADFSPFVSGVDVVSVEVNDANWAVVERMAHWLAAVGMFTDHPWLGVGIGNYAVAYPNYALGRWRDPLGHAHNYYLNIAAEAGLLGLVAYLFLFATCFIAAWRAVRRTQGYWRAVALGGLGVLVHLCIHNLFDNLFVHSMNVQLGLFLGLLFVAEQCGASTEASASCSPLVTTGCRL